MFLVLHKAVKSQDPIWFQHQFLPQFRGECLRRDAITRECRPWVHTFGHHLEEPLFAIPGQERSQSTAPIIGLAGILVDVPAYYAECTSA